MKTIKRFLSALIFYPVFVLWFIPRQKYIAYKKAEFEFVYGPDSGDPNENGSCVKRKRSKEERKAFAKMLYDTEIQVALAGFRRSTSKRERKAVYQEHLKAIKNALDEKDEDLFK